MLTAEIIQGDALQELQKLKAGSVHCCVTSPPYWGLRDYQVSGQLGLEKTPEEYVSKLVEVFREVRRVLRPDGTLWLNMGDSYSSGGRDSHGNRCGYKQQSNRGTMYATGCRLPMPTNMKPKDLVGIPWRVAFALQSDGWYLRIDIIWSKPNPMPESVTDRPTKSHEYFFLLSKRARYFYDSVAIQEPFVEDGRHGCDGAQIERIRNVGGRTDGFTTPNGWNNPYQNSGRNKRSVWTIPSSPYSEAHFATFPPDLIKPCILAGTSAKGCCPKCGAPWERMVDHSPMVIDRSDRTHEFGQTRSSGTMIKPAETNTIGWQPICDCGEEKTVPCTVLDPFAGSGTTGMVALELGRKAILIELNPKYVDLIRSRTNVTPGLALA